MMEIGTQIMKTIYLANPSEYDKMEFYHFQIQALHRCFRILRFEVFRMFRFACFGKTGESTV